MKYSGPEARLLRLRSSLGLEAGVRVSFVRRIHFGGVGQRSNVKVQDKDGTGDACVVMQTEDAGAMYVSWGCPLTSRRRRYECQDKDE